MEAASVGGHLDAVELMVKPTTFVVGFVFGETCSIL